MHRRPFRVYHHPTHGWTLLNRATGRRFPGFTSAAAAADYAL